MQNEYKYMSKMRSRSFQQTNGVSPLTHKQQVNEKHSFMIRILNPSKKNKQNFIKIGSMINMERILKMN